MHFSFFTSVFLAVTGANAGVLMPGSITLVEPSQCPSNMHELSTQSDTCCMYSYTWSQCCIKDESSSDLFPSCTKFVAGWNSDLRKRGHGTDGATDMTKY
ncbi:hypothetical protein Cpir12675_002979 [Ceratocystis pirilliformis]|uniref:Uncharacterized protein n=1 Tax=Ceratocystis pirilliformis TaxID=259994 RepID=A0ABR3Z716_9PEZI